MRLGATTGFPFRLLVARQLGAMEQRVNLITLGVADVQRARAFYQRLGWVGQETEDCVHSGRRYRRCPVGS